MFSQIPWGLIAIAGVVVVLLYFVSKYWPYIKTMAGWGFGYAAMMEFPMLMTAAAPILGAVGQRIAAGGAQAAANKAAGKEPTTGGEDDPVANQIEKAGKYASENQALAEQQVEEDKMSGDAASDLKADQLSGSKELVDKGSSLEEEVEENEISEEDATEQINQEIGDENSTIGENLPEGGEEPFLPIEE